MSNASDKILLWKEKNLPERKPGTMRREEPNGPAHYWRAPVQGHWARDQRGVQRYRRSVTLDVTTDRRRNKGRRADD